MASLRFPSRPLTRATLAFLACVAALALAPRAMAQEYPNKPIRFVVASAAGGVVDIRARRFGARLAELSAHDDDTALLGGNTEVVTPTPEQFRDFTRSELERWKKMSDEFGIKWEQP